MRKVKCIIMKGKLYQHKLSKMVHLNALLKLFTLWKIIIIIIIVIIIVMLSYSLSDLGV